MGPTKPNTRSSGTPSSEEKEDVCTPSTTPSHVTSQLNNNQGTKRTASSPSAASDGKTTRTWNSSDPYPLWKDETPGVALPIKEVETITRISELLVGSKNLSVKGRITLITTMREFENSKGGGNVFDFTILDETGETIVTVWNKSEIHAGLKINDCVTIKNCTAKQCTSQFLAFQLALTLEPSGTLAPTDAELPQIPFSFVSIEALLQAEDGVKADVLAVCFKAEPVRHVPTQNPRHTVRDIYLTDKTKQIIKLTLWNDDANNFEPIDYTTLALRKVRVKSYDGKTLLNKENATLFWSNPDVLGASDLLAWFKDKIGSPYPKL